MRGRFSVSTPVPLLAVLTLLLLFDFSGFVRLSLLCALLHEMGHIAAFVLLTGRLPRVTCSFSGLRIEMDGEHLPLAKENLLLLCGPLANLLAAGISALLILSHATFGRYFFACENLCLALFNLLPVGFLDGGRLAANLLGVRGAQVLRGLSIAASLTFAGFGLWLFAAQKTGFLLLLLFCLLTLGLIVKNLQE
ncbi:MAG TPA: hypothetical protein H9896_07965 [Candidatus Pygmaiobacter gallistercoris]|nr:hypothetical protein [Candidatus Pygmaiobacter gallistercoris]